MDDGKSLESLPSAFWDFYYLTLFSFLLVGILGLYCSKEKNTMLILNVLNLVLIFVVPIINMLNVIVRKGTELEHLIYCLKSLHSWAIFVSLGYLYLSTFFFINITFIYWTIKRKLYIKL